MSEGREEFTGGKMKELQREREATDENLKEGGVGQIEQAMGMGIAHFLE